MHGSWISRLAIGQKLVLSFSLLLILLIGSLGALLFHLSHVNSYLDRHERITVPALVSATTILKNVGHMRIQFHHLLEHQRETKKTEELVTLGNVEQETKDALDTYQQKHAARTHPVLFSMLAHHGRVDLVDEENRTMAEIAAGFTTLTEQRLYINRSPAAPTESTDHIERIYEQTAKNIEAAVVKLIDVDRKIDAEMKLEGDRIVNQARLIALGLVCLLGTLIVSVFLLMRRQVADPLRKLSVTADRVAHHDLTAQFEPWPSGDEVGTLSSSLISMLSSLRDHSKALVRKTKELEAFTYSIAHDLKGPLREIEGFSALLEKQFAEHNDPQVKHRITVIRLCALRLTRMIDALLKYSRLEQQNLPKQRFNLASMVQNLVDERLSGLQDPKPSICIDLPYEDLYGDPVSVQQALANLLDNAIKFSRKQPHPTITISGSSTPHERILFIRDNGIGFDIAKTEKIFGLFERLHGPQEYEGTGVGLAIVKLVMDKHGGRVWAESVIGKGSTFSIAFPDQTR